MKFSTVCAPFPLTFCNFGSGEVTGCYCCPDADAERSIANILVMSDYDIHDRPLFHCLIFVLKDVIVSEHKLAPH